MIFSYLAIEMGNQINVASGDLGHMRKAGPKRHLEPGISLDCSSENVCYGFSLGGLDRSTVFPEVGDDLLNRGRGIEPRQSGTRRHDAEGRDLAFELRTNA